MIILIEALKTKGKGKYIVREHEWEATRIHTIRTYVAKALTNPRIPLQCRKKRQKRGESQLAKDKPPASFRLPYFISWRTVSTRRTISRYYYL